MELAYPHEHTGGKMTLPLPLNRWRPLCHSPNWMWLHYNWEGMIPLTGRGRLWELVLAQIASYWINFLWIKVGREFVYHQVASPHCLDMTVTVGGIICCLKQKNMTKYEADAYLKWHQFGWSNILPRYALIRVHRRVCCFYMLANAQNFAGGLTTTHWLIDTHTDKSVLNSDVWWIVYGFILG